MKKYLIALLALAFHGCQKEEAVPPCTISGFTPSVGLAGTVVTISGANFSTSASQNAVTFNGINGTVTNVSATSLTVTVPVIATTGSISVTTNEHTATTSAVFTVVGQDAVLDFSPASGAAGRTITIAGNNFDSRPAFNIVKFNGIASLATASSPTSIKTTVPSGAITGTISVTVDGIVSAVSTKSFVVIPTVGDFSPSGGYGGVTSVVISGTGFDPTAANDIVKVNGLAATVTAATSTAITATVPAGTTSGKITVTVGDQTATSSNNFTILGPTMTGLTPTSL